MTDIQKQLAEALEAVDKNAVKHCATEYSIDRDTLLKVQQALAAHRQQEARLSDFKILTLTTAYEQGVGKGRDGYRMDQNPYSKDCDEWSAWEFGRAEGIEQAARMKQEARGPLTDGQRIDWLCEEAEFTCGQWQVVIDSDKESFIDAVDEMALRAHGIKGE